MFNTMVVEYGHHRAKTCPEMDRWGCVSSVVSHLPRDVAAKIGRALGAEEHKALGQRLCGLVGLGALSPVGGISWPTDLNRETPE
jgi:hypothetical protein